MDINNYYNIIKSINDGESLKNLVQTLFKSYCTSQTATTKYVGLLVDLTADSMSKLKTSLYNLQEGSEDPNIDESINQVRKLIISIGLIGRYSPYIVSFKEYLGYIVEHILLNSLQTINAMDMPVNSKRREDIQALYVESIRSYTLILQAYGEHMEQYGAALFEAVSKHINDGMFGTGLSNNIDSYSLTSIIELLSILIQTTPQVVRANPLLVNHVVNALVALKLDGDDDHTAILDEMVQVLGHYLQLFIVCPFQSLNQDQYQKQKQKQKKQFGDQDGDDEDDDEDDEDEDEDDDEESDSSPDNIQIRIAEKRQDLASKITVAKTLNIIDKLLTSNGFWDKETNIMLLAIIASYSLIHHGNESVPVMERIVHQFSDQLALANGGASNERANNIINSLAYLFSNTPRDLAVVHTSLCQLYQCITQYFTRVKSASRERMDSSVSREVKAALAQTRELVGVALGKMLLVHNNFSPSADEFLAFAFVLAEPLVLADFIYALVYDIKHHQNNGPIIEMTQRLRDVYLPKTIGPLISQLKSKYQSSPKLAGCIIKAIGKMVAYAGGYMADYFDEIIDAMAMVMQYGWEVFSTHAVACISTLAKVVSAETSGCTEYQLNRVMALFGLVLSEQIVANSDDDDHIDIDEMNRIKFMVLEEVGEYLEQAAMHFKPDSTQTQTQPSSNILSQLMAYLMVNIGVEEVTFDSELYLRMSQLTTLKQLVIYQRQVGTDSTDHIKTALGCMIDELVLISKMVDDQEMQETLEDHCVDVLGDTVQNITKSIDRPGVLQILEQLMNEKSLPSDQRKRVDKSLIAQTK
ncbi:hypothetical protein SAMD00019534_001800 [Acytostelium subglobosum LB1]|uniref:hypothetical protein n=1 Tax=Acytostelium subglobosum LB1 TaxID=1410327 RepID=UPI000644CB83|nr:hypothetical protein SAMD00019534_001800 [Acytostelium subglobosum LB1]GAM17005.1 hypothetical protein SAMD00019534_001800 [Acytostelium subglobosum LB1]|eukprot:XP_012759067.1 hypothetical protein SAMD00019534_001800 [Acytostelium subglobosum LB1]